MKNIFLTIAIPVFVFLFLFSQTANASLLRGTGGRVIYAFTPGVTCPGVGPMTLVPPNFTFPAYPYYLTPTSTVFAGGRIPRPGQNFLGSYPITPIPLCFTDTPIPLPVPVFSIIRYGTSR
ncbi:MAG: hypothetical protein RL641_94 [Candidatus Parcubacteria bacterium]|jgi:hypothetical protein